jgi:hypothetical protein
MLDNSQRVNRENCPQFRNELGNLENALWEEEGIVKLLISSRISEVLRTTW